MTVGFPYPALIVDPQGVSTSVTISDTHGNTASVYADAFANVAVPMPQTITARTTYFMPGEGPWTVTPTVDGVALSGITLTLGRSSEAGTVLVPITYARSTQITGGGGGASPATTVTGPDSFGATAVVGTSALYARADHDHGLPAAPADVPLSVVTAAGDLIVATGAGAVERLAKGTAGQVLTVGGADPSGLQWATASGGGGSVMTTPQSGQVFLSAICSITGKSSAAVTQNLLYFLPFIVPVTGSYTAIGCDVTTGVAGSTVTMGIYSDSGGPATLLYSTAAQSSAALGLIFGSVTATLNAGFVWLAVVGQGGAPSLQFHGSNDFTAAGQALTNQAGSGGNNFAQPNQSQWQQSGVTGALPATATPALVVNAAIPVLGLTKG